MTASGCLRAVKQQRSDDEDRSSKLWRNNEEHWAHGVERGFDALQQSHDEDHGVTMKTVVQNFGEAMKNIGREVWGAPLPAQASMRGVALRRKTTKNVERRIQYATR